MALPLFDTVTVIPVLVAPTFVFGKATGSGERLMDGTSGATPVPVKKSATVEPSEPLTVSVADSATRRLGVNVSLIVQVAATASDPPFAQLPVPRLAKSAELVPVSV